MMLEQLDNLCGKGGKERTGRKGRRRQGVLYLIKNLCPKYVKNSYNYSIRKQTIQFLKRQNFEWVFQGRDTNGK